MILYTIDAFYFIEIAKENILVTAEISIDQ